MVSSLILYESQEELDKALAYWQDTLNIRDWKVKATISPMREIKHVPADGETQIDEEARFARIWLLDPADRDEDAIFEQDHEETLVHELLHIFFHPLNEIEDDRIDVHIEQSINAIAEGLIRLKRGDSRAGRFAERFMRRNPLTFRKLASG